MTYMDKILKEFGIERIPLTNVKERVVVSPEYCGVDTYAIQENINMMGVVNCDPDMRQRYVEYHARFTVDKVLDGVREHVKVDISEEQFPMVTVRATMDIVRKRG